MSTSASSAATLPATLPEQSFEQELNHLQGIVAQLESGELSLEETIAAFQHGSDLVTRCQGMIANAELRITKLSETPESLAHEASSDGEPASHRQLPGL